MNKEHKKYDSDPVDLDTESFESTKLSAVATLKAEGGNLPSDIRAALERVVVYLFIAESTLDLTNKLLTGTIDEEMFRDLHVRRMNDMHIHTPVAKENAN